MKYWVLSKTKGQTSWHHKKRNVENFSVIFWEMLLFYRSQPVTLICIWMTQGLILALCIAPFWGKDRCYALSSVWSPGDLEGDWTGEHHSWLTVRRLEKAGHWSCALGVSVSLDFLFTFWMPWWEQFSSTRTFCHAGWTCKDWNV